MSAAKDAICSPASSWVVTEALQPPVALGQGRSVQVGLTYPPGRKTAATARSRSLVSQHRVPSQPVKSAAREP